MPVNFFVARKSPSEFTSEDIAFFGRGLDLLWDTLLDPNAEIGDNIDKFGQEAIRAIDRLVGEAAEDAAAQFTNAKRLSAGWPVVERFFERRMKQSKVHRKTLASESWRIAGNWLSCDPACARVWMAAQYHTTDALDRFLRYLPTLARRHGVCINELIFPETPESMVSGIEGIIAKLGGHGHFRRFALAILISQFVDRCDVTPEFWASDPAEFDSLGYGYLIRECAPLWQEPFRSRMCILPEIPATLRPGFVQWSEELEVGNRFLAEWVDTRSRFEDALSEAKAKASEAFRRMNQAEKELARTKRQRLDVKAAAKSAPATPASGRRSTEVAALVERVRLAERRLEHSEQLAQLRQEELAEAKLLIDALLEEKEASPAQANVPPADDICLDRVVVVGGHERLHAKLRPLLPRGVFLHPDRQFQSDVFESASAVLFCVQYCSHQLTLRAASEVRRRGIPIGYSAQVHLPFLMQEIRRLVGGPARPSEPRVAS